MQFLIENKKLKEIQSDCEIILVMEKNFDHKWVKEREDLKTLSFKANSEETAFLPHCHKIYAGCESFESDEIRIAVAKAVNALRKTKYQRVKIGGYSKECIKAIVEGALFGEYEFDRYKSKKESKNKKTLVISTEGYKEETIDEREIEDLVKEASIIAKGANFAKNIVNTPPDDMTPKKLAKVAKKLAKKYENIKCFVGDEKFLKKEKMGAFLAVSRASTHSPRLIHLKYRPKNKAKAKFVFVGKGLTYDSGGLSLKPSNFMVTMKSDKSGAAAAISIIKTAAALELPFEIDSIIGAAENMIGGNAYKPDDVLTAKNGKTIEVRNTDAEGRLVLADCLCYAQEQKPDYLIDLATLTGACVVALGEYTIGVMGHSGKLKHSIIESSKESGELCSSLPFNRYLKKLLKSSVADISNISSSRYGGAITAALFLDNFIKKEYKDKWLHLDIAGPAYVEKAWGYNKEGATGAGVRLALYWMQKLAKEEK